MIKLRWPWYREPPTPRLIVGRVTINSQELETKWQEVPKTDPPDPKEGDCLFCKRPILCTEDHLRLQEIGGQQMYVQFIACEDCGKQRGLKW